eukprot:1829055-Rhodomonas_salina.1
MGCGVEAEALGMRIGVGGLMGCGGEQELFQEHGGPIKKAEVFYKQDGSSSGQAEVIFKQKKDAEKVRRPGLVCSACDCVSLSCPVM